MRIFWKLSIGIFFLLALFAVIYKLRGRIMPNGALFVVYLSFYSLWRLGIDYLRDGTPFMFGLHQAQVIGIIVLAIAVPWLAYRARWARKELAIQEKSIGQTTP